MKKEVLLQKVLPKYTIAELFLEVPQGKINLQYWNDSDSNYNNSKCYKFHFRL